MAIPTGARPGRRTSLLTAAILAALTCTAGAADAQPPGRAAVAARTDSIAARWIAEGRVAGMSIAVVRGRDTLVFKGYGRANLELDVPTPGRALYEIGSDAKTFTAAAILRLAEQGRLSLDDPLETHLPGVIPADIARRVTLRHMLTHTSGIRDYGAIPEFDPLAPQDLPQDTLVRLIAAQPLNFEPGTAQAYSNSAYLLLGLVIQRVTGKSWEEYVEQELFPRAGMTDSRASRNRELVPRLTTPYQRDEEWGLRRATYHAFEWIHGNGGIFSTTGDMIAWMQALHGGRILGPAAYREMLTPGTLADGSPLQYGKGIVVGSRMGYRALYHGGTFPGYISHNVYFPEHALYISVLINSEGGFDEDAVAREILAGMLDDRAAKPGPWQGRAADYTGTYRANVLRSRRTLTIAADSAGQLTVTVQGSGEIRRLEHVEGDRFTLGWADFTFVRDGGRVAHVRWTTEVSNVLYDREPPAP
jgi:CubicO group peptidase (beta-lactamase class C family)